MTRGWITHNGYHRVRVYDHPHRPPGSLVYEHVRKVELRIGRKLRKDEAVDHVDGDKLNNDDDNLRLTTFPAHGRRHAAEFDRDECGRLLPKRRRKHRAAATHSA